VPTLQDVVPRPNANDANKAIDNRPTKLNFMRFLYHPPGLANMALPTGKPVSGGVQTLD
jgi:hypothetical protein